jgi:hypothetical protein
MSSTAFQLQRIENEDQSKNGSPASEAESNGIKAQLLAMDRARKVGKQSPNADDPIEALFREKN